MKSSLLPRGGPSGLFLLAAVAVVVITGGQTVASLRAQQRSTARVLHDHAATALWYFEQNLESELHNTVECVFHDALHTELAGGVRRTLRTRDVHTMVPPPARLLDSWFVESDCRAMTLGRPAAVFRFGPADDMASAGLTVDEATMLELRASLEAALPVTPALRRDDRVAGGVVAGVPWLIYYSRQNVPGGQAIYAVLLDSAAASPAFNRALREFRLLPPPVLPDSGRESAMRISVGIDGGRLFTAGGDGRAVASEVSTGPPVLGGLVTTAEITSAGATLLAQPQLSSTRLPALLVMLALSLALVLLAYRQLRREQELAAMRADFVASVSHELRTPLSLVRIFLDTIRQGRAATPDRLDWALGNIDTESRRLEHLVGKVLLFAQSERGRLEVQPRRAELGSIVRHSVDTFQPLSAQYNARIEVHGDDVQLGVDVDEAAFHQAIANTLENALKYGPMGQVVTVRIKASAGRAIVEIDDQGPGLPADEHERVVQPFRRGRATRGGPVAGSGIGLAVVRDVMEQHGGTVSFDDVPGGGLRVRLMLPLRNRPAPGHAAPTRTVEAGR